MNILIADDSLIIRNTLQRMISPYTSGAEIYFAENVDEALICLTQFQIDILILDIQMPGGSGFDVLKEAKKQKRNPCVIILTNYATESYRKKAIKDGADYFFDKSTDYEELIMLLNDKMLQLKESKS
jgi:YesN/AraC family two-component response regulator